MSLTACGGGGSGATGAAPRSSAEEPVATKQPTARVPCPRGPTVTMSKAELAELTPLTIPQVSGSPPHHLRVIDIRKGSGPAIPAGNRLSNREEPNVGYFSASYTEAAHGPLTGHYGPTRYV